MTQKVKTGIKRNWFQILFGYKYVANLRTKEIHSVDSGCKCLKDFARHNQKYLKRSEMVNYLANGYNGCRWCMSEIDKG